MAPEEVAFSATMLQAAPTAPHAVCASTTISGEAEHRRAGMQTVPSVSRCRPDRRHNGRLAELADDAGLLEDQLGRHAAVGAGDDGCPRRLMACHGFPLRGEIEHAEFRWAT